MFQRLIRCATSSRATLTCTALVLLPGIGASQGLEEILVTATRHGETDIQSTPIAVTAVTEADMDLMVPRDIQALAGDAPNVVAGKQPGFNSANWAIRGVGQASIILYYESQVGTTVDDFVIPHIQTANLSMLDIDRVEILRGPQGTLFGKNTTGGVINVRTNPAELGESSLEVRGRVGEFGRTDGEAVLNLPIGENIAFRAAAQYLKSDGYFKNGAQYGPIGDIGTPEAPINYPLVGEEGGGDGRDLGGDDVLTGRFKLRWQATEDLDLNLTYEAVRDESDSPVSVNGTPPGTGYLWNALGFTADPGDQVDVGAVSNREDNLLQFSRGHEIDVDGIYLHADWSLGDNYLLNVMGGYRETDSWLPSTYTGEVVHEGFDDGVGTVSLFDANRQDNRETTQVEARLSSTFGEGFNWLVGAFYQEDDTIFTVAQTLGFVDMTLDGQTLFGDPFFFNHHPQVLSNGQDAESYAVFADVTWDLTDRMTLSAGARWTHEEKDWTGRNQVFTELLRSTTEDPGCDDPDYFAGPTWQELGEPLAAADFARYDCGVIRDSEEWDEPTWRVALGYQFTDALYGYLNYARGFKSGGYNDQSGTGGTLEPIQARPTDPETADSYEIGVRSELLDNTLRLNLTGFWVTYDDSQQPLVASIDVDDDGDGIPDREFEETRFFNAAKITVYGAELETTWLVTEQFTLRGNLGWLDAEFDEFAADTDFDGVIDTDLSSDPVGRAPELTWGLFATYEHNFLGGTLTWAADANYEDEAVFAYTAVPDTPNGMTDDRTILNASITYTAPEDRWFVRVFGKNLTDEEYRIGELPVGGLWVMSYYGEPMWVGLEAGVNLGW